MLLGEQKYIPKPSNAPDLDADIHLYGDHIPNLLTGTEEKISAI